MKLFNQAIKGKVILNIQANSIETAVQAKNLLGNAVMIGVTAKAFPNIDEGVAYIHQLMKQGVQVSAGLGDGSADQWERALQLALGTNCVHLNQVFPAAALSQALLVNKGYETVVNSLIRPTGKPDIVNIATGPLSQEHNGEVSVDVAVSMLKEMNVKSIKFFPIKGTTHMNELRTVAKAAAANDLILEPTGGITPENVAEIVKVGLDEGVKWIMPHLYGSLMDPETSDLDLSKLKKAKEAIESLFV